ncbi:MAG: nicotinate-nucleotide adenylyltransferase [Myxococcales bacterium]|nr:nicotinate-nucleotide adenylyltransferase [Myxococcales bacterium]
MKLGILGGTFDPIHLAHLRIAEEVRLALELDRVFFVPASNPPHRPGPLATATDRLEMVRIATAPNPAFEASDLELRRVGQSYTVDTLRAFSSLHPGSELWFIIGSDAVAEIDSWREPDEVLRLARFAIVSRPGSPELILRQEREARVSRVPVSALAISAREIRARCAEETSIRYLVPDAVLDYIRKHRLYAEDA